MGMLLNILSHLYLRSESSQRVEIPEKVSDDAKDILKGTQP